MERIAHGIRSPIGPLSHALTTLQSMIGEEQKTQSATRMALRSIARLAHMADRLDLAAEIERGEIRLHAQQFDLAAVVRAQLERSAMVDGRPEVQLSSDLPASLWITGDPTKVERAAGEIIGNALRHARTVAHVRLTREAQGAVLDVEDDGVGVPEPQRASLLDRTAPRTGRAGLGLGLDIARAIALAHGGTLALESSTLPPHASGTVGARFILCLPIGAVARG